ncbi:MAG: hypothetical protein R6W90_01765 [Ignavibacteriaceae bacterium]
MLDKILNITPGSDYKNSQLKKGNKNFAFSRSIASADTHDSFSLSPAWTYMSQLNWQILGLKMLKDEKLTINFIVNDIEFRIVVDLNELNNSSTFVYELLQKKAYNEIEKYTLLILEKKCYSNEKTSSVSELKNISRLFERVWDLNLNNELNDGEFDLNTLLSDGYEDVDTEINYITISLITFLEKLLSKTFSYTHLSNNNLSPKLKIRKIKSANA